MININLLPESMRRREGMPRKQLLGLVIAVLVAGLIVSAIMRYHFVVIPELQREKQTLTSRKKQLEAQVAELKEINNEIGRMSGYVNAVKELYKQRVVWAKILSDLKHIVNFDKTMSEYNTDQKYLWLTNITANDKALSLTGFATASTQVVAMQMPERILQGLREYSPVSLPEKDEEARLMEELRVATNAHELERRDNPNLPLQGPEELTIRARLEEIKSVKSGGVALLPFSELFAPGSLQLRNASWVVSPRPSGSGQQLDDSLYPTHAWSYSIMMTLK